MTVETIEKLDGIGLQVEIQNLDGWKLEDGHIVRTFRFPDFVAAVEFVNRAAGLAETAAHHPDIDIRYNQVRMALVTHDCGGVSPKDMALARQLNETATR